MATYPSPGPHVVEQVVPSPQPSSTSHCPPEGGGGGGFRLPEPRSHRNYPNGAINTGHSLNEVPHLRTTPKAGARRPTACSSWSTAGLEPTSRWQ